MKKHILISLLALNASIAASEEAGIVSRYVHGQNMSELERLDKSFQEITGRRKLNKSVVKEVLEDKPVPKLERPRSAFSKVGATASDRKSNCIEKETKEGARVVGVEYLRYVQAMNHYWKYIEEQDKVIEAQKQEINRLNSLMNNSDLRK